MSPSGETDRFSRLTRLYTEFKAWGVALIGAGALATMLSYVVPQHEPIDKKCEIAMSIHTAYQTKVLLTPLDKALAAKADDVLIKECLN